MNSGANVLSALMKLAELRQMDVANHLGVSRSTLASWLAGYARMPDEAVLKIHRLVVERMTHGCKRSDEQ